MFVEYLSLYALIFVLNNLGIYLSFKGIEFVASSNYAFEKVSHRVYASILVIVVVYGILGSIPLLIYDTSIGTSDLLMERLTSWGGILIFLIFIPWIANIVYFLKLSYEVNYGCLLSWPKSMTLGACTVYGICLYYIVTISLNLAGFRNWVDL